MALLLAACSSGPPASPSISSAPSASPSPRATDGPTDQPTTSPSASPRPSASAASDPIEATLASLSLEERVGQLLMPYAYGASADAVTPAQAAANRQIYGVATPAALVARYHLGGMILLPRNTLHPTLADLPTDNATDPARVPALTSGLQTAALADSGVPLLIATDQEEGIVTRIGSPLAVFGGSMPLGAARQPDLARNVAAATGAELRALGVNLDLAPDADVNVEPRNPVIGLRSFGDDPTLVGQMVAAQVVAYQSDAGIGAAAKHFPGHGDTTVDSHTGLPVIGHDLATLRRVDLPPFSAAISAGVDVVMAGHLLVPALDPAQPATLSSRILGDLLRTQLGFRGVVMTDSLWMQGIRSRLPNDAEAALRTLRAGADILLMPPDLAGTVRRLVAAVHSGQISQARLDASVRRVLALKQRLGLLKPGWRPAASMPSANRLANDRALAQRAAQQATTLLSCRGGLPLGAGTRVVVVGLGSPAWSLAADLPHATAVPVDFNPSATQIQIAARAAGAAHAVVLLTYDANASAAQQRLLAALVGQATPVLAVSIDLPYDLAVTGSADAQLATYGAGPISMQGLARALADGQFSGRLPVRIPGTGATRFAFGAGMNRCP